MYVRYTCKEGYGELRHLMKPETRARGREIEREGEKDSKARTSSHRNSNMFQKYPLYVCQQLENKARSIHSIFRCSHTYALHCKYVMRYGRNCIPIITVMFRCFYCKVAYDRTVFAPHLTLNAANFYLLRIMLCNTI